MIKKRAERVNTLNSTLFRNHWNPGPGELRVKWSIDVRYVYGADTYTTALLLLYRWGRRVSKN